MATNIYFPTAWLNSWLDAIIGGSLGTMYVEVYTNNATGPSDASVIGDFVLGSAGSLGSQTLGTWDSAYLVGTQAWKFQHAPVTFTNSTGSPINVYGYIVFDAGAAPLWVQKDPNAPVSVAASGGTYKLTVGVSAQSVF